MKLIVTNPTGSHCFIGHTSHAGIDIAPVSKNAGPQEFEIPEGLVGYFTRAVNAVIPLAVVTLGNEQAEAEAQAQDQADADTQAQADAEAKAKAQAEADAKARDAAVQEKRPKTSKTK